MRYAIRKTIFYVFTAWAAITINFFLPRMLKGDPVSAYINQHQGQISPEAVESLKTLFGLDEDKTLIQQYFDYWVLLFKGDLGESFSKGLAPVTEVIGNALPWTIGLVGIATIISFAVGTLGGAYIGWKRGSKADAIVPVTTFLSAVPYFWMGLIIVSVFSNTLGWFPASHAYDKGAVPSLTFDFISQVIAHGFLPIVTIVLSSLGGWILGMRNQMVTVLDEDYITVAEAKGLRPKRVMLAYAARNAVLPQLQSFAMSLGFIVGGTLVMELVFSYPGVGKLLLDATNSKDYPLMQGLFLIITLTVFIANILADVAYAILDPRTRQSEE